MSLRGVTKGVSGLAALALMLAGCGGGSSASSATTQAASGTGSDASTSSTPTTTSTSTTASTSSETGPTLDLPLESSIKVDPLPARYTCDGGNVTPPIKWSKIPPKTAELFLFAFNTNPVHGKAFGDWAVAGLKPGLHGLSAGKLPAGAIVGRNDFGTKGYSVCPPKGTNLNYLFILYAVPHKIAVAPGFNANELRKKAGAIATHGGLLAFSYKRR